ncbi:hypothetical protein FACS1894191_3840 [Clostridia bacterium]|nr:hypothetical protein FACS1894191_3840 [Clostridia bacterium]
MKFDVKSIGVKLWIYFILFAAVILISLWLLQIVFMQSFYESMKAADIKKTADTLVAGYGREDFEPLVDSLTFRGSMLVFVTDMDGNIIYSSDEHGSGGPDRSQEGQKPFNDMNMKGGPDFRSRPLPRDFSDFLKRLGKSAEGFISYTDWRKGMPGKVLIAGAKLPDAALYISSPLEPMNATTEILRTQLVYVTFIALLLSFVIAYFIARKFSRPVSAISRQARELAGGSFEGAFSRGFCSEIDELAGALDYTAVELSKTESLRRELIANISHDLRTPLTMIKAYAEMIRDISGDNREKREAHLAVITGETDRLGELVDDILELSAIQSGAAEAERENLNLSETVKKILSRFAAFAEHQDCAIDAVIEPDQYVLADERKISQVVYNLIGNAINYMGEDKTVKVELADLGARVRFAVTDNGGGIPKDELPLIWDRYYKSKSHSRGRAGTGLGLSIARGVLELHGAEYGVDSAVGRGSVFWFELKK